MISCFKLLIEHGPLGLLFSTFDRFSPTRTGCGLQLGHLMHAKGGIFGMSSLGLWSRVAPTLTDTKGSGRITRGSGRRRLFTRAARGGATST